MPSPSRREAAGGDAGPDSGSGGGSGSAAPSLDAHATRPLGAVDPCGSRQRGRRSAVALVDDLVVVGTADGDLRAFERGPRAGGGSDGEHGLGSERWRRSVAEPVVALTPFDGGVVAGTRGERGAVVSLDADGTERWRVESADDVGTPAKETRFWLPFVAALATEGSRAYAAARRYERRSAAVADGDGGTARRFESVVYAFDADGTVRWRHTTRASPVAIATDGDRLAVAYNRCPEPDAHREGLVVLDAETGTERIRWDPRHASDAAAPADAERAVGDVALTPDGYAVASHADRRGYFLDRDGAVTETIDLGATVEREPPDGEASERVYAYPNHVVATSAGAAFVLGNSFPETGRETAARHPAEHAVIGVTLDAEERWRADVGGFAHHVAGAAGILVVPTAQHFRDRDPAVHGVQLIDLADGTSVRAGTDGVTTSVAVDHTEVAAVEEPVQYHDGDAEAHGAYRLHSWRR